MIGIVRAYVDTPYTSLMRQYNHHDFDLVGIYYEQDLSVSTIFYDVYSSRRIPQHISIGDVLCWKSTIKVDSERYEVSDEVEQVIITSLLLTNEESIKGLELFLSSGRSLILDRIHSYELYGRHYESTRYDRSDMPGVDVTELDKFYKEVHSTVFDLLCSRSLKGISPFPKSMPDVRHSNQLEKKLKDLLFLQKGIIHLSGEECNLGGLPFITTFTLNYKPKEESINLALDHFVLRVTNQLCDMRLVDTKSLYSLLIYMETLPHESYTIIRKSLLEELKLRGEQS